MTTRRTILAAGAAALAVSGALSGVPTAHAQPGECTSGDVRASYRALGGAAGHHYGQIRLTNISHHRCVVQGYGGLSYVGHGDGTQVGAPADRDPARLPRVVLDPGQHAASRVDEVSALNYPRRRCHPTPVDGFRVYVPDSTVSQYVVHPTTGCARAVAHLLSHRPFRG